MDRIDGRDARWHQHRLERRDALVDSTLRAIRSCGPQVTIEQIAAAAGTSKTVLYRYFGDRTGLYLGVVDRVSRNILAELEPRMAAAHESGFETLVTDIAAAYAGLVQRDPEIYAFVTNRPASVGDPVSNITDRIAEQLAATLRPGGAADHELVETFSYGLVGFLRSATSHWVASGMTESGRKDLVRLAYLTFTPTLRELVERQFDLTTTTSRSA